jgi:hypothetical protein
MTQSKGTIMRHRSLALLILLGITPGCSEADGLSLGTTESALEGRDLLLPPGTDTVWHGVWLATGRTIAERDILQFETDAQKTVGVEIYYSGWYVNAWADLQRQLDVWEPLGIKTHVVWEPRLKGNKDPLAAILNGSQDAIIADFAERAKAYGKPFFLRFAHEMNGNWYPWSGAATGQDPQKYIDAWKYVWNMFDALGAKNAIWVWAPNWNSVPAEPWNDAQNYYPLDPSGSDKYVDWVGVDFFGLRYDDLPVATNLNTIAGFSSKPLMVAETSAADCASYFPGATRTKAQWIGDLFGEVASRPAIRALFWFNENKWSEADWRITSCPNPEALMAYRAGVADPRYVGRGNL